MSGIPHKKKDADVADAQSMFQTPFLFVFFYSAISFVASPSTFGSCVSLIVCIGVKKLRVCALPSCTHIENENEKFKLCGRCMALAYCSVECQKVHWKLQHGKVCIPAAAAKK